MQKKIQVENKHMKNTYLSLGKCKLKKKNKNNELSLYSVEWLKSRIEITANTD